MATRRVWIVNQYAVTRASGAGTRHADLGSQLVLAGWDVTILAGSFNHFTRREERLKRGHLSRTQRVGDLRYVWIRTLPYDGSGMRRIISMVLFSLLACVVQFRHQPSPTHIIGSIAHPLAAAAALVIARLRGGRYFLEIRDLWPQSLIDLGIIGRDSVAAKLLRSLERVLVEQAETVFFLPEGVPQYLAERGIRARKMVHLPNGVQLSSRGSVPAGPAATVRKSIMSWRDEGCFVVVYAGAHGRANGLDTVLEAARRLSDHHSRVRFVMIGDGAEKPRLTSRVHAVGLTNVRFFEPVPKKTLGSILSVADACLVHVAASPVHKYGVSFNKLYDYFAAAKPVVFACETSMDPVADAGAGVSLAPGAPDALADVLEGLSNTPPAVLEAMGQRGRHRVVERHDIRQLSKTLSDCLSA